MLEVFKKRGHRKIFSFRKYEDKEHFKILNNKEILGINVYYNIFSGTDILETTSQFICG
jgi:hypothetical protein